MNIQHIFAKNMKALRKAQGLTQEDLSERCSLHRTYIGGIEQERINVSLKNINKIADALGVNPAFFFVDNSSIDLNLITNKVIDKANSPASKSDSVIAGRLGASVATRNMKPSASLPGANPNGSLGASAHKSLSSGSSGKLYASKEVSPGNKNKDLDGKTFLLHKEKGSALSIEPIEVEDPNLTLQILCSLIQDGYQNDQLAERYKETKRKLLEYFFSGNIDKSDTGQKDAPDK